MPSFHALIASAVAALAVSAAGLFGQPSSPAGTDYVAVFVRMAVPDKVAARQAFLAKVTMRNTGSRPWEGAGIRLRSANPRGELAWGTDYILIAQGTTVAPGKEYTFTSWLKAPAKPGKPAFQWQVCKDGTMWFGQATPDRTIEVTAAPAATQPATAAAAAGGEAALTFADFEYVGSFKAPKAVGQARGAFSESGLALRPVAGGPGRLFMNYTHPTQVLFEIEIPEPVKVENGNHAGLKTAEVAKVWGPVQVAKGGEPPISPNGGFVWVDAKRTLLWTWYHGYKTGSAPPVLGAAKLADDGKVACQGPWYVSVPSGLYKSYWGGVMALPRAFADKYTDGRTLALGFGGYYSICAAASRGPALGVIGEPDAANASVPVPVTEMLVSPHDKPAPRDGDYLNANCGFWADQAQSPERGSWTYDDWCRAGAFIDGPAKSAYVAFVRLGTGRLGYDFGSITSAGQSEYWYFYSPADLGRAAKGETDARRIQPTSMARVRYPLGRTVTGACYDSAARRLYLCVSWAYPDGKESHPVIHVYRVR